MTDEILLQQINCFTQPDFNKAEVPQIFSLHIFAEFLCMSSEVVFPMRLNLRVSAICKLSYNLTTINSLKLKILKKCKTLQLKILIAKTQDDNRRNSIQSCKDLLLTWVL